MRRLFSYYSPKLPLILASKFEELAYNPDEIMSWYMKLPNFAESHYVPFGKLPTKARLLVISGYYFWVLYAAASLLVLSFSPIAGLVGLLISPFVVTGLMYAAPYAIWHMITEPKRKSKRVLSKKQSVKNTNSKKSKRKKRAKK